MSHKGICLEEPSHLDLDPLARILAAKLSQTENTTAAERERVERERKIAANSLHFPATAAQLPPSFLLPMANVIPSLGQKISSLSGVEGVDRVAAASQSAIPTTDIAGSIYDIEAAQTEVPLSTAIEEAQNPLREYAQRVIETGDIDEMAEVAEMPIVDLVEKTPFPNLAREIMKLGMGMEGFQTARLAGYKKQGDEYKEKINLLLSLSSHLPKLSAEDTPPEMIQGEKEAILKIHEELKAKGIDIFPGKMVGEEFSKEELAAANSLINHHIDVSRTSLQELFTTKISLAIQFLSMMGEVMKKISEKDDQQKRKANQLPH